MRGIPRGSAQIGIVFVENLLNFLDRQHAGKKPNRSMRMTKENITHVLKSGVGRKRDGGKKRERWETKLVQTKSDEKVIVGNIKSFGYSLGKETPRRA
jgi:hypothetical protein